jgi:hypothetical protein
MHDYYYNDQLRWLINDDEHDYIMMMYLLYIFIVTLYVLDQDDHLYSWIMVMVKMIKVKY